METITPSVFWPVFVASIGGIIVLTGVFLEVMSEKHSFKNIRSFRRWETAKCWGEWMVVFGILLEVTDGGMTAANQWINDPMKRPIALASARVSMIVKTRSNMVPLFINPEQIRAGIYIGLSFCRDSVSNNLLSLEAVPTHDLTSWRMGTTNQQDVIMRFNEGDTMLDLMDDKWSKRSATTVRQIAEANVVILHLPDMETNAEVLSGVVVLNVNDSTWRFEIPRQIPKWGMVTTQKTKKGIFQIFGLQMLYPQEDGSYSTNWYDGK
jgi:hypothetical protein